MEPNSSSRIIGDVLEINADIIGNRVESKYPPFIANLQANKYRRRLIKSINKFKNSNYVLNKDNVKEFFIYIHNNYDGNYNSIQRIVVSNLGTIKESIIGFINIDNAVVEISINADNSRMNINIVPYNNDNSYSRYNISLTELYSKLSNVSDYVHILNTTLRHDIATYLLSSISKFTGKNKGYFRKES